MSEQLTEQITNNEEEKIQLPEPFQNEPENKQQLSEPVSNNPENNAQALEPLTNNNQQNSEVKVNTEKSTGIPPNKNFNCMIYSAVCLLIIEVVMNFCFVIRDVFESGLRYSATSDEKRRDSHIGPYFLFGMLCLVLAIIVPFVCRVYDRPKVTLISVSILIFIKSGLFVSYFLHLRACRSNDDTRVLTLIPEIGFNVLMIIHEINKFNYKKNNNQKNN